MKRLKNWIQHGLDLPTHQEQEKGGGRERKGKEEKGGETRGGGRKGKHRRGLPYKWVMEDGIHL